MAIQVAPLRPWQGETGGTLLSWVVPRGAAPARPRHVSTVTAALPGAHREPGTRAPPYRVNLICRGFVDTPLSASLLAMSSRIAGNQLRSSFPSARRRPGRRRRARGTHHDEHRVDRRDYEI